MKLNSIYLVLNILALVNIVLLCSFLLIRKNNPLPNILLAFILSIPGLYLIDTILVCTDTIYYVPYYFFFAQIIANLFPVAVYYYVHLLLGDKKKFNWFLMSGTILNSIYSIGLLVYFILLSASNQHQYLDELNSSEYPLSMDIYNMTFYIWQVVYFIKLFFEIKVYQKKVKQNLSDTNEVKLSFVKEFVWLMIILDLALVVAYSIFPMTTVDYGIVPVMVTIIYIFIIFFSIRNNAILSPESYTKLNKINYQLIFKNETKAESVKQDEQEQQLKLIEDKIKVALNEDKIYRSSDVTLASLADSIEEKNYVVSKALNLCFNKNFYEIINEYRINEALVLLKDFDSKNDKIDNIALKVGFNSRATFYRSFKKLTNKNPSDFV